MKHQEQMSTYDAILEEYNEANEKHQQKEVATSDKKMFIVSCKPLFWNKDYALTHERPL